MAQDGIPVPDVTPTASTTSARATRVEPRPSHWKRPADRERFLELYRALRDRAWSDEGESRALTSERDLDGPHGTTHVFHWAGTGVPVVFVHGAQANSIMWAPIIDELRDDGAIYALETPGDPNESVQTDPFVDADGLVTWLDETLDALGVERAHLVGASYGGWLLLHHASRRPERVASLSLVEPAMEKVRPKFILHGLASGLAISVPGPQRRPLARRLDVESIAADPVARKMGVLAFQKHRRTGLPRFTIVPDDLFAGLTPPTMALFASRSPLHHPQRIIDRLERLNPGIATELVPQAGHTLPIEHPAEVAALLQPFFAAYE